MKISLQGKTILVTGGTGGIGQELVQVLSREGAQVLFTYFSHKDRTAFLENLGATSFYLDLNSRSSIKKFCQQILGSYPSLDGIINNAGISKDHTLHKVSEEEFDASIEVNLTSVFLLVQQLLPLLEKPETSKIINIVSRVGIQGNFGQVSYASSKAGLIALTKTMASELGCKGILVNAVTPGYVLTDMTRDLPDFVHEQARSQSYLNTISEAEEVAQFIAYLMSDLVTKVSGQIFHYDTRKI